MKALGNQQRRRGPVARRAGRVEKASAPFPLTAEFGQTFEPGVGALVPLIARRAPGAVVAVIATDPSVPGVLPDLTVDLATGATVWQVSLNNRDLTYTAVADRVICYSCDLT